MSKYFLRILLLTFVVATIGTFSFCFKNKNSNSNITFGKESFKVDKIIIYNKTQNELIKQQCVISDSLVISNFIKEYENIVEVKEAKVNINKGFYDIFFIYEEKIIKEIEVIYTTYDGVIVEISTDNKLYKNDKLESLALYYMQTRVECDKASK